MNIGKGPGICAQSVPYSQRFQHNLTSMVKGCCAGVSRLACIWLRTGKPDKIIARMLQNRGHHIGGQPAPYQGDIGSFFGLMGHILCRGFLDKFYRYIYQIWQICICSHLQRMASGTLACLNI